MAWVESLVDPLCTYCGDPANSIDHIVPIIKGGTSERENLTPACMDCNRKKRAMNVDDFLKTLEQNDA
jgi:5-methylcytosine-specific restriction endonuclease McrA